MFFLPYAFVFYLLILEFLAMCFAFEVDSAERAVLFLEENE